jgi:hypothetical protein
MFVFVPIITANANPTDGPAYVMIASIESPHGIVSIYRIRTTQGNKNEMKYVYLAVGNKETSVSLTSLNPGE